MKNIAESQTICVVCAGQIRPINDKEFNLLDRCKCKDDSP